MLSVIIMEGRLTGDPILKRTPTGVAIVNINIACNDDVKRNGVQSTVFIKCTFFGSTAETVAKSFRKGRAICVQGRLACDKVKSKTNPDETREFWYINCTAFSFVTTDGSTEAKIQTEASAAQFEAQALADEDISLNDDGLPF